MPLYLRILLLFLLNIAILIGAVAWTAHHQMQSGLQSFLGTLVGARLQKAAEEIQSSLEKASPTEWNQLLGQYEQTHGVKVGLFEEGIAPVAGSLRELPSMVRDGLLPRFGGQFKPPGMGPPGEGVGQAPMRRIPSTSPASVTGMDFPKALVRTGSPPVYWASASLPPFPGVRGLPRRHVIAIVTDSVLLTPLLFDSRPWLLGGGAALLVSCLLWFPFVRGITMKLRETTQATRKMASGELSVRIRENRRDEIGQLASAVNSMACQLEGFVQGQRRFTRDIAHELCSPISRMQAAVGVLDNASLDPRERHYVDALDSELQHMSLLVQELLQFAKATQAPDMPLGPVVLDPLVQMVIDRECGSVPDPRLSVQVPNDLIVIAEPTLLARALANILRNALRYAGDEALIEIQATRLDSGRIRLRVSDNGPGVPVDALPRLFEPFYRPDDARSPGQGGAGLGLAIVRHCIQVCGGTVEAGANHPTGLSIVFELQAAVVEGAPEEQDASTALRL